VPNGAGRGGPGPNGAGHGGHGHRRPDENRDRRRLERERRRVEEESAYAARQLTGLLTLMAIAEPETTVVPFSGASVGLRYTGPIDTGPLGAAFRRPPEAEAQPGVAERASRFRAFLRSDQMLRNAFYIILNSGAQAALGFAFWIMTARFFSTADVGRASSLISALSLLSFLGLLGLNTTFIRYLPVAPDRNRLMTSGIMLVAGCGGLAGIIYVLITPRVAPSVAFIAHNLPMAIGFVLISAAAAVNILTDSVFIAVGKSSYNAIVDGVIGGSVRIVLLLALAGGGAFAIFGVASASYVVASIVSLILMVRVLRWRPNARNPWQVIKPVLRFSGANYLGNVFNLLPTLVVPLIVLNKLGPTMEAFYYVAFQLALLLYTATSAVEQAFLAEGASNGKMSNAVLMRSLRILLVFCIPAFLVILLFGHFALLAFGAKYAANAGGALIALAAAVLPIAADNWFLTVLRLSNRLHAIVWSNGIYGAVVIGLAWVLAPHGLTAVSLSWPIGASAGALVAGVPAIAAIRRNQRGRHRTNPMQKIS
jgi:O-antigen/teichoic acid export membrane protein